MAYATISEVRALDGLDDADAYPDAVIQEAIDLATEDIDGYTGATWEAKPFQVTVEANGRSTLVVPVLFIRTLTAVTIDGEEVDASGWVVYDHGEIHRPDGYFSGYQVTIEGTAGVTQCHRCYVASPCDPIRWATRTLAGQYAKDLTSRIPDRALQVQSDFGSIQLAQAGGPDRPTSLPEVNARLKRHRHK